MWGNFSAEMIKLVKRPANWLLFAVAIVLGLLFTYVIPYAGYAAGTGGPTADRGLAALVPAQLVGNSIARLPVFLGAIMVILGVLAVGGEYGWETWKTVLTQGPSRLAVYAGKLAALAVAALAVVVALFAVGTAASMFIAAVEDQPMALPPVGDLVVGLGAGWLIAAMWTAFGVLLAVLLRGVALALGLGLVWLLAVQNLLARPIGPPVVGRRSARRGAADVWAGRHEVRRRKPAPRGGPGRGGLWADCDRVAGARGAAAVARRRARRHHHRHHGVPGARLRLRTDLDSLHCRRLHGGRRAAIAPRRLGRQRRAGGVDAARFRATRRRARPGRARHRRRVGGRTVRGRRYSAAEPGGGGARPPTPGLAQLPALRDRLGHAGLPVTLSVVGVPAGGELPVAVDLAGYRIVQEALTNVLRHAGATTAQVRIEHRADAVEVEVTDSGLGGPPSPGGTGIAGMRERATALGGELQAGPRHGGGFRVHAVLPLPCQAAP